MSWHPQICHCWGNKRYHTRHHTSSDVLAAALFSIRMYVFIRIRSCRREDVYINTRLLFQSPAHWRLGQTLHDSALTLPLLFTMALRLPGNHWPTAYRLQRLQAA